MWKLLGSAAGSKPRRWPDEAAAGDRLRGRVEIDFASCTLSGACSDACPTPALRLEHNRVTERATLSLDLGQCVFCGLCEDACAEGAIKLGSVFEMAVRTREDLRSVGTWGSTKSGAGRDKSAPAPAPTGAKLREQIHRVYGRSLHVRVIDAGDCGGCLAETAALSSALYDVTRYGIDFVASPGHADLLLITGTVTAPMESHLMAAWEAMPEPRLVVALGACAIGGGIYEAAGARGTPKALPVDVWVPGCPPRPQAILHALRLAVGAGEQKQRPEQWRGPYPGAVRGA